MANRFILNETSYHGDGAVKEIATEVKAIAFKKAFIAKPYYRKCTDWC